MKKREIKGLSLLVSIVLVISISCTLSIDTLAVPVQLFTTDFEEASPQKIIRTENVVGRQTIEDDPAGGEGHCLKANLSKSFFGLQPNGIGNTLYSYGTFKEGDTFHLRVDVYPEKEGTLSIYPFILLCINGYNPKTKEEKLNNYDEWYPKEALGTLTINEGGSVLQGNQWNTLDYTFTVKDGCSSKGRDISFWTDSGAFYIYFETSMAGENVYVDNVTIDMDTNNEPTKTLPGSDSTTTKSSTTTTTTSSSASDTSDSSSEVYPLGDANLDKSVDMKDVLVIRKHIAHMDATFTMELADFNFDNSLDMKDVLQIRKVMAGMEQCNTYMQRYNGEWRRLEKD